MRRLVAFIVLVGSIPALAQSASVKFLSEQLASAKDPRVRVSMALNLAALKDPSAVAPLCRALADQEAIVRVAAANALADLKAAQGLTCLQQRNDTDQGVRQAIAKAVAVLQSQGAVARTMLYVLLEPLRDEAGAFTPDDLQLAEKLLKEKLQTLGAALAPAGEAKSAAQAVIRSRKLKGYALRPKVLPHANGGVKVDVLVMTYPDNAIQGTWAKKASGAKVPALLKAAVPALLDEVAQELEWSR